MIPFKDREEVEEWLDELDYEQFWQEIAIFDVGLPARDDCEADIARGADRETVLFVLKGMARLEIVKDQQLRTRNTLPDISVH